jgi:hypothetical protein
MAQAISTRHLAQFLKAIAYQGHTGMLRVEQIGERRNEQGEIYFESGHIVYVRAGTERGSLALRSMNNWEHVVFIFKRWSNLSSQALPEKAERAEESRPSQVLPAISHTEHSSPSAYRIKRDVLVENPQSSSQVRPRTTRTLIPQSIESLAFPHGKASQSPQRTTQPLRQIRDNRADPRQTRYATETCPLAMPQRLPATPRPGILAKSEGLPGCMTVFKTKAMVTTTEIIQSMERRERIIFILLDGCRTILDIARLTHHTEDEVKHVIAHLFSDGYIEYVSG